MELTFGTFLNNATLRILAQLRLLIVFDGVLCLFLTKGFFLYCIVLGLLCCCIVVLLSEARKLPEVVCSSYAATFLPYPAPNLETDF